LVVAHPDDEGGATPYLAGRFTTSTSGLRWFLLRGVAAAGMIIRESTVQRLRIFASRRRGGHAVGWESRMYGFLDGKDTASQNVLNSLANWGHGANLEALVRIVRLTRPEVIISWLPAFSSARTTAITRLPGCWRWRRLILPVILWRFRRRWLELRNDWSLTWKI